MPVQYKVSGSRPLNARLAWAEDGAWVLDGRPTKEDKDYIDAQMPKWKEDFPNLSYHFSIRAFVNRRPQIARLRAAYLWAFSVFGYGFILNTNLEEVRRQILHPEEAILEVWDLKSEQLPDVYVGINILTAHHEIRSFLVVFDSVAPQGTQTRYGVLLPGPQEPGQGIYAWLMAHQGNTFKAPC